MQAATNNQRVDATRLSNWSIGVGGVAFLTMSFNPLSVLGATALVPGIKAVRARAPHQWRAVLGMVLGVLATAFVVSYFIGGGR